MWICSGIRELYDGSHIKIKWQITKLGGDAAKSSTLCCQACAITTPDACTKYTHDLLLDTARYSFAIAAKQWETFQRCKHSVGKDVWWDAGNGAGRQRIRKQRRYQKQGCTPLSLKYNFSAQSAVTAAFPLAVKEFGHHLGYVSVGVSRRGKLCRSVIPHLAQPPADASSVFFRAVDGCEKWQRAWTSSVEESRKPGSDKEPWPKPLFSLSLCLCITVHFVV